MHVQIVTYRVEGVSGADFTDANRKFAEAMAAVPGLLAKLWLKRPDGGGLRRPVPLARPRGVRGVPGE